MAERLPQSVANEALRTRIDDTVTALWARLPVQDAVATRDLLLDTLPGMTEAFGDVAGSVAADRYDAVVFDAGLRVPPAQLAPPVASEAVEAGVRWSVGPLFGAAPDSPVALARAVMTVEQLALGQSDATMKHNATRDHVRFAWVPAGPTCAFCTMLASRGPVYRMQSFSRHAHCDCSMEPVASSQDLQRLSATNGYDPDKLYDVYREASNATSGSTKAVLSEMRKQNPGME